jgi:S-adenosyl-L-methionine hydrolase (adenosine-forming)
MGRIVTLLTDFGTVDGYVGAMKGVILVRAPDAHVVDLTHDIPPQDVRAGAWALREAARTFPADTIHVAVVDPEVGTGRRPLLLESAAQLLLGPDNGVLSLAATAARGWVLDRPEHFRAEVSATFHGRDIFAAVAGRLAAGLLPGACGSATASWVQIDESRAHPSQDEIRGHVVHADRFGNLVTNVGRDLLGQETWSVRLAGRAVGPLRRTFGDVARGEWVAYLGSAGRLEIAVRDGSAREAGGNIDDEVILCRS